MNPVITTYIMLTTVLLWLIVWAIYEATPEMRVQKHERYMYALFVGFPGLMAAYGTALTIQILFQ